MASNEKQSRRCFSLLAATTALALLSPVQARAERRRTLFRIARSLNANVVQYEARLNSAGEFERLRPLVAYWLMYAEDGRHEELGWFERQFAYGWSQVSRSEPRRLEVRLTAFSQRNVLVRVDASGAVRAELTILGRDAVLQRIFVQLADGAGPTVRYIDLFGTEVGSGRPLRERLEP